MFSLGRLMEDSKRLMEDSEGTFSAETSTRISCRKCRAYAVFYSTWESNCGGYEDDKYECKACGFYWWVDGPDA